MKPLSERQARNCEEAREPVCKCRCGGALHGARRGGGGSTPAAFFESLPETDPHFILSEQKKAAIREKRAAEKRRLRQEAEKQRWDALLEMQHEQNAAIRRERENGGLWW